MIIKTDAFYSMITTDKFKETVQFYEKHFGFVIASEKEGFVRLRQGEDSKNQLGIIDINSLSIAPELREKTSGVIMRFFVENADLAYQELMWENANIISEVDLTNCGNRFFMAYDPNGIILHLTEDLHNVAIPQYTKGANRPELEPA